MKIIKGSGGGKGGGAPARVATEAPDNLQSKQFAKFVDLVSEGEINGLVDGFKSIFFDNTPMQNEDGSFNIDGVSFDSRSGIQGQTFIAGFPGVESEKAVSVEVTAASSIVRSITDIDTDSVRVTLSVPRLTSQDSKTGDISGTKVQIEIDLQDNGGGFVLSKADTITGKTSSRYQRSYNVPLTGTGPWDIRVRRITADSTSQALQNQTFWDSYTEIIDEKFSYPNSALMALSIDSELFSKVPTRGYEIEGIILQVPSNYDAETRIYTGVWDGTFITAYSNNPAWIFYDLVINSRYGLGDYVSAALIDKWTLFEIGQYCDELVDDGKGGTEPRFTVNVYIQTREEAIKTLQALASAFAAMSFWAAGAVTLTQDSPKEPIALFTPANVIGGSFSYAGSSARTRSTVIGVTWNDPLDLYRQAVEYIEDAVGIERFGFIKKDVVAFGCTSRGQAHRFGKAILFTERMETDTVTFSTGLDGLSISPGEVFQTSDPVRSGDRMGGRLQSIPLFISDRPGLISAWPLVSSDSAYTLDNSVTIDGSSVYTLWAVMPDGTVEQSTVTNGAGATTTLTVDPAFSDTPELQSIWVLGSTSANPEKWRVISISEDGVNASITGLEYRADKYAAIESDIKLDPIPISNIRVIPEGSSDIVVTESLYMITDALVGVRMSVSWKGQAGARYELEHRPVNGNWIKLNTSTPSIDVEPVVAGINEIRITAISGIGLRGPTVSTNKEIFGLKPPPDPVANFHAVFEEFAARLIWDKIAVLDIAGYEIQQQVENVWLALDTVDATTYKVEVLATDGQAQKSYLFRVRGVDTGGRVSVVWTYTTATVDTPPPPALGYIFDGPDLVLTWSKGRGDFPISDYRVYRDGVLKDSPKATQYRTKVTWGASAEWGVSAVDVAGNEGPIAMAPVGVALPSVTQHSAQVIDNNVLLRWAGTPGSLPIERYAIRKGAGEVDSAQGTFAALFESEGGTFTYSIVPVDTAGNEGAGDSRSVTVNEPPDFVLHTTLVADFTGARTNVYVEAGTLVFPVSDDTWGEHFTNNSWATPQDQINAGFPVYIQPTPSVGSYTDEYDIGVVIPSSRIEVDVTADTVTGNPDVSVQIETRETTTDSWTVFDPGQARIYSTNFRYIRMTLTVQTDDSVDLARVRSVHTTVSTKLKGDQGTAQVTANPTRVDFNTSFIDIDSIVATIKGTTSGQTVMYDFLDAPNPTGFDLYVFDDTGNPDTATVSWQARGS